MFLTRNEFAENFHKHIGFVDTGKIIADGKLFKQPYEKKDAYEFPN